MRASIIGSLIAAMALATATGVHTPVSAAAIRHSARAAVLVYSDTHYGLAVKYPAAWHVQQHIPMYVRVLKRLNRVGTGIESPDQNAFVLVVAGRGTYNSIQLRALERDALTQMVQTAGSGITYRSGTVNRVTYQLAHTYGQWYDYGNHIAVADQLCMATSRGPYTYVFVISVKLRTPSTSAHEAQAATLIKSIVVR
jgi:hypothetical protein